MNKNQRGNTLVEVIVSFVIVTVVIISLSSVFISNKKINNNIDKKENIYQEVSNILTIFTANPKEFETILKEQYKIDPPTIYFSKNFKHTTDQTTNYIKYAIENTNDGFYRINIQVFINNEEFEIAGTKTISRIVYAGE